MKRYHMIIHGLVQGVGFRFHTESLAERYHMKGWVRNNFDGTVEIDAEGKPDDIEDFLAGVKEGPGAASVTDVALEEREESGGYTEFKITY